MERNNQDLERQLQNLWPRAVRSGRCIVVNDPFELN